jgi:hypothetical protein
VPPGPRRTCGAIRLPFGAPGEFQPEADSAGLKLSGSKGNNVSVRQWSARHAKAGILFHCRCEASGTLSENFHQPSRAGIQNSSESCRSVRLWAHDVVGITAIWDGRCTLRELPPLWRSWHNANALSGLCTRGANQGQANQGQANQGQANQGQANQGRATMWRRTILRICGRT